jgi:HNH endonuclease
VSQFTESTRAAVVARAGDRCEYCRLPSRGQVATFPIDHVIPRTAGGTESLDNLSLACPHCNAQKWAYTDETDPDTGEPSRLFNPRFDVWEEHFRWSAAEWGILEGRTPVGRATIIRLQMNAPDLVAVRRLLAALGVAPDAAG